MKTTFSLSDFDFTLPDELIAQHPAAERSASRLLDGRSETPVDRRFTELPDLLQPGDLLVLNDTQVVKARLFGQKSSGGRLELLIERVLSPTPQAGHEVAAHMKVSKKPLPGAVLQMDGGFTATLLGRWPHEDGPLYRFALSSDPYALMASHGHVPLPPYITHTDSAVDEQRYQTVFAKNPGAVAAPTAALHFDEGVLAALEARGVQRANVTLHVGAGTFAPMKTERIEEHVMHHERYAIPPLARKVFEAGYRGRSDLEVRSAGVAPDAIVPVTEELLQWAETVFAMDAGHRLYLQTHFFSTWGGAKRIECLDIPDLFHYMNPELVRILTEKLRPYLGEPMLEP